MQTTLRTAIKTALALGMTGSSVLGSAGEAATDGFAPLPIPARATYELTTETDLEPFQDTSLVEYFSSKVWKTFEQGKDVRFTGAGGVEIKCRQFHLAATPQRAIVIASGRTESLLKYAEVIYDFGRNGYSVHLCDHRGQGLSGRLLGADPEMGHVESFYDYVEDLKHFVDQHVKPLNYKETYLLGHSMGGAIASLYIERYPHDFEAAALLSPMHEPLIVDDDGLNRPTCAFTTLTRLIGGRSRYVLRTGPYQNRPFENNKLTQSPVRYYLMSSVYERFPLARLGGPTPIWLNEACKAGATAVREADRITVPVLILQAGDDTAVIGSAQEAFCRRVNQMASPNGKGKCMGYKVEDAWHELLFERDAFRTPVLTTILDFFGQRVGL